MDGMQPARVPGPHHNSRKTPKTDNDFWRTPADVTRSLLAREPLPGRVWECACGDGTMSEVIKAQGYSVVSTDLIDRGYGQGGSVDFLLTKTMPPGVKSIVTNPPFKLAGEFAVHALQLGAECVALLAPLSFLASDWRWRHLFARHPPRTVWVFVKRKTLWVDGVQPRTNTSGTTSFAWFVWSSRIKAGTQIQWIED